MNPTELWPHQSAAIEAVLLAIRAGRERGMVVLPTGTGKTGMVLSLGRRLGAPLLFLVNRDELLGQTCRGAARFWPEASIATITAGTGCWDHPDLTTRRPPDLVVSMVPSLVNRLRGIDPERFALVVADECHLSAAPSWARVLDHFTPGFLLGVTATPARHDRLALDRFGEQPLYSYSLYQAIKDGRLVRVDTRQVRTRTDLDGVGVAGEDLREKSLARAVDTADRNLLVADAYREQGRGRRALAFCVDREHAHNLAAALGSVGARCQAVTGDLEARARRDTLARFARGELDVLTNCEVLTTGFDDPGVACLLMARPTASRTLYVQMIGRGLRLAPGKPDCLVLDFTDNCKAHKLVCAADLLGRPGATADTRPGLPRPASAAAGPLVLRQQLLGGAVLAWQAQEVCPWPELPSLDGYAPCQPWQGEPASAGQLAYLRRLGLALEGALTRGEASYLIDRAREYDAAFPPPATARQKAVLESAGLWSEGLDRRQASSLIDTLRKVGAT